MKRSINVIMIALASFFLIAGSAWSQGEVETSSQAKLLALRAAYVDAYRNLAETVKGFQLDSKTTVRDFIVENDVIRVELHTSLQGAYVTDRRFLEGGLVEVDMAIEKKSLPSLLRQKLEGLPDTVKATGAGAPPLIRKIPIPSGLPEWSEEIVAVKGRGASPKDTPPEQAKLLAIRAAQVDAYRNLAETVWGLSLDSYTKVKDFVVDKDVIWTEVHAFVQGARVTRSETLADSSAEVTIELSLAPLCQIIKYGPYEGYKEKYPFGVRAKLLALRAAKVDGQRNLLETIKGVRIDSETTVEDFLLKNEKTCIQLRGNLQGAKVITERILPGGIAEADLEVLTKALPQEIYPYLEAIGPVIKATGAGVHPGFWDEVAEVEELQMQTQAASSEEVSEWQYLTILVKGRGAPGDEENLTQRKLMAERAAKLDAYRNLGEEVFGLYLDSVTTVELFVVGKDIIRTKVSAFIQGAQVVSSEEQEDGSFEVEVELKLRNLPDILGVES